MVLETHLHLCFWWKTGLHLYLALCLCLSVIPFLSLLSVHIIMSGRQISTVAIVGPSVYLLTRKDSLCYNRLISLPPRTFISSPLKIETIIAVGGGGGGQFKHCSHVRHPPPQTAEWPWQVQSAKRWLWRMTNGALIAYYCVISSSQFLLSVGEMDVRHISVYICVCSCVLNWVTRLFTRGKGGKRVFKNRQRIRKSRDKTLKKYSIEKMN